MTTPSQKKRILGLSAYYHDSAVAVVEDGVIVTALQEERFSRVKHDDRFPSQSIHSILREYSLSLNDFDAIIFYEKPFLKFERLLETYHAFAPKGFLSFAKAMPVWIKEKLFLKKGIITELKTIDPTYSPKKTPVLFSEHHLSHGASAFFPSPFKSAAILTIDGVGEWATTTIGIGHDTSIKLIKELQFPHSVGLLYSAFTYFCGFKVNSGEYKLMGLAPYGQKDSPEVHDFYQKITTELVHIFEDGSIQLNMAYFNFATGTTMTHDSKWTALFGISRQTDDTTTSQSHINLALAAQLVTEDILLKLAKTAKTLTGESNLVLAGFACKRFGSFSEFE